MEEQQQLVDVALSVAIIIVGGLWVVPYFARLPIVIPGETMMPGEKPIGRLFVMLLGAVLVVWGVWRLFAGS